MVEFYLQSEYQNLMASNGSGKGQHPEVKQIRETGGGNVHCVKC